MRHLLVGFSLCILSTACVEEEQQIIPIPFNQVTLTDVLERKNEDRDKRYTSLFLFIRVHRLLNASGVVLLFVQVNPPNCRKHIASSVQIYIR